MKERCAKWGNRMYTVFRVCLLVALFASVILNVRTDAKRRELNQRYERLIEQEETLIEQKEEAHKRMIRQREESHKYMIKTIEEFEKYVAEKKKEMNLSIFVYTSFEDSQG